MEIRKIVNTVLQKLNINSAPIPIEKVANIFALEVLLYPNFPDSISGTIIKENGLNVIGVNSNHSRVRQRFTIAHELGHYIMGHDENSILDDKFDKKTDKEREANKLAGALLMPFDLLKRDIENEKHNIPSLAKKYEVSEQAMSIRLIETSLLNNKNLGK